MSVHIFKNATFRGHSLDAAAKDIFTAARPETDPRLKWDFEGNGIIFFLDGDTGEYEGFSSDVEVFLGELFESEFEVSVLIHDLELWCEGLEGWPDAPF